MFRAYRILVVEDDSADFALFARLAREASEQILIEAVHSRAGATALALLRAMRFDAVFLDFRLGPQDAYDVLFSIRTAGFDVPVTFLVNAVDVERASCAVIAGASDYIPKSELSPDAIRRAVQHAVREREWQLERRKLEARVRELEQADVAGLLAALGAAHPAEAAELPRAVHAS